MTPRTQVRVLQVNQVDVPRNDRYDHAEPCPGDDVRHLVVGENPGEHVADIGPVRDRDLVRSFDDVLAWTSERIAALAGYPIVGLSCGSAAVDHRELTKRKCLQL